MHKKTRVARDVYNKNNYDIKSEFTVSAKNFEVRAKTTINGRDALCIDYESRLANQLASYSLLIKEIKFCKKTALLGVKLSGGNLNDEESIYIRDEEDEVSDILKSLTLSLFITYSKMFSQSDSGRITLDARDVFKNNKSLIKNHEFLIEQRNTYVAHAGDTHLESAKTVILLDEDPMSSELPKITVFTNHMYCFEQKGFEILLELVDFIESKVLEKSKKIVDRMENKELVNFTKEQFYFLALMNKPLVIKD